MRTLVHFVDQHGYTDQLFGLCHLLGYSLRACLRIPSSTSVTPRWTMLSTLALAPLSSYHDRRVSMHLHPARCNRWFRSAP
jgi:hypothetical protein